MLLSAIGMVLGFAGYGVWPLAFVAFLPALFVFDPVQSDRGDFERPGRWRFVRRAFFFGYLAEMGGFGFLIHTLVTFSDFPWLVCLAIASIFFAFQGLQFVLILSLFARARARGWPATPALVASYLASEMLFPQLFEHYFGAAFAPLPILMQIADLGGPMVCTALIMTICGAIYESLDAYSRGRALPRLAPSIAAGFLVFSLGYGAYRLQSADAAIKEADHLRIGIVQANVGIFDPASRVVQRHVEQTLRLVRDENVDLVVWPESSMHYDIPSQVKALREWNGARILGLANLGVPFLFGGVRRELSEDGVRLSHNSAFLIGEETQILGTYDKTYLLAFGEYLPFSDTFPFLHDLSPRSGNWTPGTRLDPVVLPHGDDSYRLGILICYEDLITSFVRKSVARGNPHALVNLTNDSWFGETQEPWVHMTLSRFRAIEHRVPLVRATLTGISVFIDPAGRILESTETFERTQIAADVPMIEDPPATLFQWLGPWPGWLAVLAITLMCLLPHRRRVSGT